ncbi:carboxypeptidase-like regulatory domain-containing protein [Pendulispora brunnea]|uniref:Carboxypeptidase-like regulatory domain-containing protein n=1 Tax=Pendulispora brunnea TaxID=2905690 RepID=A0ABZ2K2F5_9BACT
MVVPSCAVACFAAACSGTDGAHVGNTPDGGPRDGTVADSRTDAPGDAGKDGAVDAADAATDGGGADGQSDSAVDGGDDSGNDGSTGDAGNDGGDDAGAADGGGAPDAEVDAGTTALITGTVVDVTSRRPVEEAAVAAGSLVARTDAAGRFALRVPTGVFSRPTVTKAGYSERLYEELAVTVDADQGQIPILSLDAQSALRGALPGYDANLGAMAVRVLARGTCPNEEGATLSISPAGVSRIAYFRSGVPNAEAPNVHAGEETSAIIYNVAVSTTISLAVARNGCTMARYPTTNNGLTRTGNIQTRGGNSITTATTFVE